MSKRERKTIYYNPHITFPHLSWKLNFNISISRKIIPNFCEQLHSIIHERVGSCNYYPNIENGSLLCRYEWTRNYKREKHALHLGLIFLITSDDLNEISAYLSTNQVMENNSLSLPDFPKSFLSRLQKESIILVNEVLHRLKKESQREINAIFYIESHRGIDVTVETEDNRVKVFPCALIKGKIVSPVRIKVIASSNENGKPRALHDAALFCALHTLANEHFCQITYLDWSKRKPPIQFIESENDFDVNHLYPSQQKPAISFDDVVSERIKQVWSLYQSLSEHDKNLFLPALFAFYSAKGVKQKYSTLAIVAHIAALSSLSKDRIKTCPGMVSCSEHGDLTMRHHIIGDKNAIFEMIKELNVPSPKVEKDLKELLNRVYYKQRSAYVHGAELRHAEFYKGYGLPSCFPTENEIVKDEYYYKNDFMAIELIARRVLLQWLFDKNNNKIDIELFNLEKALVAKSNSMEASYVVPNVWIKPFHDGQKLS